MHVCMGSMSACAHEKNRTVSMILSCSFLRAQDGIRIFHPAPNTDRKGIPACPNSWGLNHGLKAQERQGKCPRAEALRLLGSPRLGAQQAGSPSAPRTCQPFTAGTCLHVGIDMSVLPSKCTNTGRKRDDQLAVSFLLTTYPVVP